MLGMCPGMYDRLGEMLPRGQAVGGDMVSGSRLPPLPLRLEVLTLQEDLSVTLNDVASRLRRSVLPPRRASVAVGQDAGFLRLHLSDLLALDQGETGAEVGLWLLNWQTRARKTMGVHTKAERLYAPCPTCDTKALVRTYGSEHAECRSCGQRITEEEYKAWTYVLTSGSVGGRPERKTRAC